MRQGKIHGRRRAATKSVGWFRLGCATVLLILFAFSYAPANDFPGLSQKMELTGGQLEFQGAGITIPEGALQTVTEVRIERLTVDQLPPLDPGMENVTAGGGGYRFLPHGQQFAKPVTIQIGLEDEYIDIKTGSTSGAHTYYWNEKLGKWVRLKKLSFDSATKRILSTTTHFTTMINSILTAPDHPSPLSFNPNSIKDIAAADPAAGIDLIEPPTANNRGTADLSYPIRLPRGRGAFSPQLTLTYSSARGNGWLGVGWDLDVSRIEIDTRWGVPFYDDTNDERKRFLLNGAAIVPIESVTTLTGPCRAGLGVTVGQQFAPRIETFQRIIRCVSSSAVHWEVTAKDGTRFEYGTDPESQLTSYQTGESSHVAIWYLRRVVDPNGNTTEYRYMTDTNNEVPGFQGEPFVQKYLKQIVYTSHPNPPTLPAAYTVDLIPNCTSRQDLIVSGRTGFKVLTRCRLAEIDIRFQGQLNPFRRYLLGYKEGEFGKSLLSGVQVQGSNESLFYEHTLDYTQAENVTTPFATTENWPVASPGNAVSLRGDHLLNHAEESSHEFSASVGYGTASCSADVGGGLSFDSSNPTVRHMDINGDGIADRVWIADGQVRALLGKAENKEFDLPHDANLSKLGEDKGRGGNLGIGGSCGAPGVASANVSASVSVHGTTTKSMLSDVDGDGLLDFVSSESEPKYQRGLPHECRDGSKPASGNCADGLQICPNPNLLCFISSGNLFDSAGGITGIKSGKALRERFRMDSKLKNELYRLDPTVRWVAPLAGKIKLEATARKKELHGDPIRIKLLRVVAPHTDPRAFTDPNGSGTTLLKTVTLPADSLAEVNLLTGIGDVFQVKFGESFLVMVDLDVADMNQGNPVSDEGFLLNVVDLRLRIVYQEVCLPNQPCRSLAPSELSKLDATGQLAYVFDYPQELVASELPRDIYWQLLPPLGPHRDTSPSGLNLITSLDLDDPNNAGTLRNMVRKVQRTKTRVHVRVRCDSVKSGNAQDTDHICPLGTVLAEAVFGPDEGIDAGNNAATKPLTCRLQPPPGVEGCLLPSAGGMGSHYDPTQLLFEVDGENGVEVRPEVIQWAPRLQIVSVHELSSDEHDDTLGPHRFIATTLQEVLVLSRVHPPHQLEPFSFTPAPSPAENKLEVTVSVVNLRKQLIVTVIRAPGEEELGRVTINMPADVARVTTSAPPLTVQLSQGLYYIRTYTEAGFDPTTQINIGTKLDGTIVSLPTNRIRPEYGAAPSPIIVCPPLPAPCIPELLGPRSDEFGEVPYTFERFGGGHHGFFYGQVNGDAPLSYCRWVVFCTQVEFLPSPFPAFTRAMVVIDECNSSSADPAPDKPCGKQLRRFAPANASFSRDKSSGTKSYRFTGTDALLYMERIERGDGTEGSTGVHPIRNGLGIFFPQARDRQADISASLDSRSTVALEFFRLSGLRSSITHGKSLSGGFSFGGALSVGLSKNFGSSTTSTFIEFMDVNGDRLPDLVAPDNIRFGGSGISLDLAASVPIRETESDTMGTALSGGGGGAIKQETTSGGELKFQILSDIDFGIHAQVGRSSTLVDRHDVNGDGLPDAVKTRLVGSDVKMIVQLNLGDRLGQEEDWGTFNFVSPSPPVGSFAERLSKALVAPDLGLYTTRDLTSGHGFGHEFTIDFVFASVKVRVGKSDDTTLTTTPITFADVNGDGLLDIVFKNTSEPNKIHVRFNQGGALTTGSGGYLPAKLGGYPVPDWIKPPVFPESAGKSDFGGALEWLKNLILGEATAHDAVELSGSVSTTYQAKVKGSYAGVVVGVGYDYRFGHNLVQMGLYDIDGDGLPDRVLRTGAEPEDVAKAPIQVQRNQFGGANLLRTVHRPLGGRIDLEYRRSFPSEDDPEARWLLTGFELSHDDDSVPPYPVAFRTRELKESFEYFSTKNGTRFESGYFDRFEREFYGFQFVRSKRGDPSNPDRVIETEYYNRNYWFQGLVRKTRVLDKTTNIFTETRNEREDGSPPAPGFDLERKHMALSTCTGALVLPLKRLAASPQGTPCESYFVKPRITITLWGEGGTTSCTPATCKHTIQRFEDYDNFGNVTRMIDEQDIPTGITDDHADDMVAMIAYDSQPALLNAHIVDRVTSIDVRQGTIGGPRLRFRRGTYGPTGNLTRHEVFADTAGINIAKLDFQYDATGFMTSVTDTNGYRVDYTPDGVINLFAIETRDSFNLVSRATYDFRFQLPTELVDENNQKQVSRYDAYGRLVSTAGPYELAAGIVSAQFAYSIPTVAELPASATTTNCAIADPTVIRTIIEKKRVTGSFACELNNEKVTVIRTARFVDGLGRAIQSQVDAEVNGVVGRVISGHVVFDAGGRLVQQGHPTFEPGRNIQIEDVALSNITEWQYDVLDRTRRTTEPGPTPAGRVTNAVYNVSVHPLLSSMKTLRTIITDPNGKVREEHRDASERLVAVVQKLGSQSADCSVTHCLITTYSYKPTGELVSIKDALGRETKLTYDLAGRRTSVTTPDTGQLTLTYDANGNLIRKIDPVLSAQGQKITYQYNKNRLVSITYPKTPSVKFIYGDDPKATEECRNQAKIDQLNILGRVCKTEIKAKEPIKMVLDVELRSYGALGEVVTSKRIMKAPPPGAHNQEENPRDLEFITQFIYDSFGRMLKMMYPDPYEEKLTYIYDNGARVKKVIGEKKLEPPFTYVENIRYDEFGQRTFMQYGNGAQMTYSYQPDTRRLSELTSKTSMPDGVLKELQHLRYTYDAVGNILSVSDTRGPEPLFLTGANREYTYDDLNRVNIFSMSAVESAKAGGATWSIGSTFAYDDVGNITSQQVTRKRSTTTLSDLPEYPTRNWTYAYGNAGHPNLPDVIGPYNFTYDARGSITKSDRVGAPTTGPLGATYAWDDEGRLQFSRRQGSPSKTQYNYDSEGMRIRKETTNGDDPESAYLDLTVYPNQYYTERLERRPHDGCTPVPSNEACWERVQSLGKSIYMDGQRLVVSAVVKNNTEDELGIIQQYFQNDPVGSTAMLTNKYGMRSQEIDYLPFGEDLFDKRAPGETGLPQEYHFDGKLVDPETDLEYFGARYYDPRMGRWISADPLYRTTPDIRLADPQSINLYSFVGNNPILRRDENGLEDTKSQKSATDTKVDVLKKAQEEAVNEGQSGVFKQTKGNTFCNAATACVLTRTGTSTKGLTDPENLDSQTGIRTFLKVAKPANEMYRILVREANKFAKKGSGDFIGIDKKEVQTLANMGIVVVGAREDKSGHGHVVTARPGHDPNDSNAPYIANVGILKNTQSDLPANNSHTDFQWFIQKADLPVLQSIRAPKRP
ncbi:hypothetical protein HY230_01470 [Candidatus Acetothermia bacterium]|nr:hypothetical protein [Candidatus Acetothermia bacterium]